MALVVLFHGGVTVLSGGFIGVDVFFVISGYLIIPSLLARMNAPSDGAVRDFYARRIRRLLPMLVVVVGVTLLVVMPLLSPLEVMAFSKTAVSVILYFSNWYFIHKYSAYFSHPAASDIFLHTWSLSVEEQFYIAAPILIYLLLRRARTVRPVTMLLGLSACSLLASVLLTPLEPNSAFYSPLTRAWEFGVGGCAALLATRESLVLGNRRLLNILIVGALLCILASAFRFTGQSHFPGYAALLPAMSAALFLFCCGQLYDGDTLLMRVFAARPFQYLGNISYSMYLWHWPVTVLVAIMYGELGPAQTLFCVSLSIVLAGVSYAYIEEPFRHRPAALHGRRWQTFAFGAGAMVFGLLLALGIFITARLNANAHPLVREAEMAQGDGPAIESVPGCMPPVPSAELRVCEFGDQTAKDRIVLFGDSHARQWFFPLNQWATRSGYRLTIIARSACPPIEMRALYIANFRAFDTTCLSWRQAAIDEILELRPKKLLIITSRFMLDRLSDAEWAGDLTLTLHRFTDVGISTYLARGTPLLPHDPAGCIARHFSLLHTAISECEEPLHADQQRRTVEIEERVLNAIPRAHYLQLPVDACNEQACEVLADGIPVFRDDSHFTERYMERISPRVVSYLNSSLSN